MKLTSNFKVETLITIDLPELVGRQRNYRIPKEKITVSPPEIKTSQSEPLKINVSLNIPPETPADKYEGSIIFRHGELSKELKIRVEVVEVHLWLEPEGENFGQVDPGRYSPSKSFALSTNFTDISNVSIGKSELQHPQGYKISEENIIISPARLSVSSKVPAEFKMKLKIPEEALAGEYSGKVTFEIKGAATTLEIRVSVSPWIKITGNPVDFGEVQAGKESAGKPFTLTSNLPELTEVTVKKYDLIDYKGHKILADNITISPERLRVSATSPPRFTIRVKVPEGSPEGKYEGKGGAGGGACR